VLAVGEGEIPQVFGAAAQYVERHKHRRAAAVEKVVELRAAAPVEADDLTVEHRVPHRQSPAHVLTQIRERLEDIAVARHQRAPAAVKTGERAKAIVFEFEQPLGAVEGGNPLPERHRRERQHADSLTLAALHLLSRAGEQGHVFPFPPCASTSRAAPVKGRDELATLALDRLRLRDKISCLYEGMG
jgi:hypothetical protein